MNNPLLKMSNLFSRGRKIVLTALFAGLSFAHAQNINNYVFSTNTSGTLDPMIGATTTAGTGNMAVGYNDDRNTGVFPLGFQFTFMGANYTHFSANSNGQMRLHRNSSEAAISTTNIAALAASTITFAPIAGDNSVSDALRFVVTGTAPNRIFKLEFPGFAIPFGASNPTADMQIWLYENGTVQYVYGAMQAASSTTRAIFLASSNTATTAQTITVAVPPTSSASATLVSNSFTAGVINGLHSTAQGIRRVLTFSPSAAVTAAPSSLNATAIAASTLTLNWIDNASNETYYTVEQSNDGGLTYATIATLPSNTITYNVTGLIPGRSYTFRVTAASEADISNFINISVSTTNPSAVLSTSTGGNWTSTSTWANGVVPTATDSVVIVDGATVTIDGTTPICHAVRVGTGASGLLNFASSTASTLTINGNVYVANGGTFDAGTGTLTTHNLRLGGSVATALGEGTLVVDGSADFNTTAGVTLSFFGTLNAKITGTPTLLDFRSVVLNKGAVSVNRPLLEIEAPFTVQGANTLGLVTTHTAGVLKINGTFTQVNPIYTTAAYTIPLNGGLQINNPNFTVTSTNGSPTVNGLLQVTSGIFNVSQTAAQVLGFGVGATFTVDGGTVNAAARINTGNAINFNFSSGNINVATVGNSTSASASFGLTSTATVINWAGGILTLVQRSTGTTQQDYNVAPTAGLTGGTLQVGNASTTTNYNFNLRGNVPTLLIDNTTNAKIAVLGAQLNIWNSVNVTAGSTLNLNGFTLFNAGSSVLNDGIIDGTVAASNLVFARTSAQTYSGTGTDTHQSISNQNTVGGVTFNKPVTAYRVNFFSPTQLINSNNINLGNGLAQAVIVQVGVAGYTNGNVGIFDVSPTFNLGTGTYSLIYQQEGATRTTGIEIPTSRSIANLTIADTNHVILAGGALDVTGTLTLTAGKLFTTTTNLLRVTATGTAGAGATTSYIDGPMQRSIPASLTVAGTLSFPVGKGNVYGLVELVNTGTNAGGVVDVLVERFNSSTGGTAAVGQLNSLYTNGYWNIAVPNGQSNLDSTYARFTSTNLVGVNRIAYASTLNGIYNPVSAGPILGKILTNKITSSTNLEGFYALGEVITPISGSFLVGASKTAPNYTSITAALTDVSGKQVQGNITLQLDADYNSALETLPINLVAFPSTNPNFTITIKPNNGVSTSISGSNATSILRFANGASNYIIDGSNNGTSTQNLVIQNTNTTGAVVMFQGTALNEGVRNTTFKNTLVKAGGNTTAYGIIVGGTTVGLSSGGIGHNNLVIENNEVYNTDYGVVISGSSVTSKVKNVNLRNNRIGTDSSAFFTRNNGVYLINADSILIENNTIFNIKQSSSINNAGIWIASGLTNSTIKRNIIKGIYSTSASGYGAYGINIASATGVDNDSIYNNLIFDIKTANYSTSSTQWNAFGIRLAAGATNFKVFYNTIHFYGAPQNGTSASSSAPLLILPGTYTGTEIRNNIFSNNTTGLTGSKHYAYWTTISGAIPGLTFNNNNFFGGGTFGILMNANGTDVNTLAGLQSSTSANANSIAVNPTFINDTNLIAGLGTVSGLGSVIGTINRDFNNALRSATTPTIGAIENTVDAAGPAIAYTQLTNTVSTNNLVLTAFAAITDISGVNVSTNKPRIYFKRTTDANTLGNYPTDNTVNFNGWKYVEASNTSSPFSFTIDYSLLYSTGAVATGDVIEYFVTAQDLIATANVSANPAVGFAATSVANITTVPTTRNSYTIVAAPLAGTYAVGALQTAPNFTSLTQAVNELNLRGVSAPVTFELTDALYTSTTETFPIAFNVFGGMGISNPVTIKPALNNSATIVGNGQSIFRINGADYITIDGSATAANTRDLTIANTSRTGNTTVIWVQSQGVSAGSVGIKIKNTKIQGDTTAVTTSFGIYAAGTTISNTGTGADNDSLSIVNNEFTKVGYAVYASGTSLNKVKGMVVSDNTIGNVVNLNTVTSVGIYVMQANGLMISNNFIKNINGANTGIGDGTVGVLIQTGVENATITKNVIDSIIYAGTGGYGGKGIDINTGLAVSNIMVSNNMISNILGDGWSSLAGDGIVGLRVLGSTGNISLIHNTVALSGVANRASSTQSAAAYVASGVTNLLSRNNIFINGIVNNTTTTSKSYAIASDLTNPALVDINYNNYFAFGTQAVFGFLGADVASLTAWKAALIQDANSVSDSSSFVSLTDLHLTGASISNPIYLCGVRTTVPDDIDGNTRLSFTYMGADEVLNNPVPVKWVSFTAVKKYNNAGLTWVTASEYNNTGFDVQRSFDGRTFETIGFVNGKGNTNSKSTYTYNDNGVFNSAAVSKVFYRLKQIDVDGRFEYSSIVSVVNQTAKASAVEAYPNPFNSSISISVVAVKASTANVEIFDISGRKLFSNTYEVEEGSNSIAITKLTDLNQGIYFVRVDVDGEVKVIKMIKN